MGIILLVLLLAIILGGLGFALHLLWWIALVVLVIWLVGFLFRVGEGAGRGRWYRWLAGCDPRFASAVSAARAALTVRDRGLAGCAWGSGPRPEPPGTGAAT